MFLRCHSRKKNGKRHRYWSVVESRRCRGGRPVQRQVLSSAAPGLTPREVLRSLAAIKLVDVHIPITDGRELIMPRYTEPEAQQEMILEKLNLRLPKQPPPRIRSGEVIPPRA